MTRILTITAEEEKRGTEAGIERHAMHRDRGREFACGFNRKKDNQQAHIDACKSELVVARLFDMVDEWVAFTERYWELPGDIGNGLQVRSTRHSHGRLLVHKPEERDKPDHAYILARVHDLPRVHVVGWLWGYEAQKEEYWIDLEPGRFCYVVPNTALSNINRLLEIKGVEVPF